MFGATCTLPRSTEGLPRYPSAGIFSTARRSSTRRRRRTARFAWPPALDLPARAQRRMASGDVRSRLLAEGGCFQCLRPAARAEHRRDLPDGRRHTEPDLRSRAELFGSRSFRLTARYDFSLRTMKDRGAFAPRRCWDSPDLASGFDPAGPFLSATAQVAVC